MSILMKRKRRTFVKIDDFEKKYVTNVVLNEGDKILITEDNIEALRKILKQSNFHWFADHEPVADGYDFQPNRVITLRVFHLYERCSSYTPVSSVKPEKMMVSMLSTMSSLTTKGALWLN